MSPNQSQDLIDDFYKKEVKKNEKNSKRIKKLH